MGKILQRKINLTENRSLEGKKGLKNIKPKTRPNLTRMNKITHREEKKVATNVQTEKKKPYLSTGR